MEPHALPLKANHGMLDQIASPTYRRIVLFPFVKATSTLILSL